MKYIIATEIWIGGKVHMNEMLTQDKSIYLQISEMIENDIMRDIILKKKERQVLMNLSELIQLIRRQPPRESTYW